MKKILSLVAMFVLVTTTWAQNIRLHAGYLEYNKKGTAIDMGFTVPSDNKTDWIKGDVIFFIIDGGDGDKAFKATYDGSTWSFTEWYKNGGMQDFKSEGGTVTFAMIGDDLNLSTMKPSVLDPSKTALQTLTSYTSSRKIGDIMFTNSGTYTVDDNGDVDINLNFTRPMAKIHIAGAWIGAMQIRNHVEGTKPSGIDNAAGTNTNYNKAKTMTLNQIIRFQPSSQTFRDALTANNMNGTANMIYSTRPEDIQVMDAVYYGTMEADENGYITIVMCSDARTYPGIEANAALGNSGQKAYWRKFPGMTINPNDDIYIYGPMSEEEAHLWTPQAIYAQMDFTISELSLLENQQINLKPYCKWKTPVPNDRTLKFEISNPNIVSVSEDGNTLTALALGTTTITATTVDGYSSTMTVNVKKGVLVNETNFPDENFRSWILNQDYGKDGAIMDDEIAGVTKIDVSGKNINNLQGIEMFTALQTLYCYRNQIRSLDVSNNTVLTTLYCADNQITSLDVSNLIALTSLSCGSNPLTSLDVSKHTMLKNLYCYGNQLTSLDVTKNTSLEILSCGSNSLTSLDISKNTALINLICRDNQLTSLDVSNNTALEILNCSSNQLTSIDLSNNTALTELIFTENKIKGSAMDALVKNLPTVSGGRMYVIDNSRGYEQNGMTPTQAAAAKRKGWIPYYNYNDGESEPATWEEYLPVRGDVNQDNEVNTRDAKYVANYIIGNPDKNFNTEAGDVNGDGVINMQDVMFIVNYIQNGRFPDDPTIIDLMEDNNYSIFLEALQRTGLSSVILKYKNDKSYYMNYPTDQWGSSLLYYPKYRDDGWTVFAETDNVFRANGINNFEELKNKCAEWYGNPTWYDYVSENGVQISTGDDYTNKWNVVHMFVAYHILNAAMPVDEIVYEYNSKTYTSWNVCFGYEPQNYYETLLPNTLMKFWETDPKNQKNLYINRYVKNNTLTDQYGTFGSDAMHPVIYSGAQINRNASLGIDNCYVHSIDKVLLYDKNAVNSQHERMRFTQNQLLPELANNGILRATPAEISAKNDGGSGNHVALPLDYFDNIHCYNDGNVLRYCVQSAWRAYESTQLQGWGDVDFAIKMPPVPTGTYELRILYAPMAPGGVIQFYIGNTYSESSMKPLGIPFDVRVDPTVEGNAMGCEQIVEGSDYGVASDKAMRNYGYMRAPASFSRGENNTITEKLEYDPSDIYSAAKNIVGSTSCRSEWGYGTMVLRRIICTLKFEQGQDYWLRMKNVLNSEEQVRWLFNCIELVPTDVYNNDTYMEDWY